MPKKHNRDLEEEPENGGQLQVDEEREAPGKRKQPKQAVRGWEAQRKAVRPDSKAAKHTKGNEVTPSKEKAITKGPKTVGGINVKGKPNTIPKFANFSRPNPRFARISPRPRD